MREKKSLCCSGISLEKPRGAETVTVTFLSSLLRARCRRWPRPRNGRERVETCISGGEMILEQIPDRSAHVLCIRPLTARIAFGAQIVLLVSSSTVSFSMFLMHCEYRYYETCRPGSKLPLCRTSGVHRCGCI